MHATPPRRGFTLLEVLLVMAILVILTAVALPSLLSMYDDTRVRGAADDVRGAWAEARTRAIDSGTPYRFAVQFGKESYRVAPDSTEFWENASEPDGDTGKVLVGSLPKGIIFQGDVNSGSMDSSSSWSPVAVFRPDGTCRNDARVVVDEDGRKLIISVRGLTGIVAVRTPQQEEGR